MSRRFFQASLLRRDIVHRVLGKRPPLVFMTRRDDEPFLHLASIVARIEALSISSGDEDIHSCPWQFDHQLVPDEHGKNLVLHLERRGAEAALRRWIIRR